MKQSTIPEAEPLIKPAPKSLTRAVIVGAAALFALCAAVVLVPISSDAIASLPSKLKDAPGLYDSSGEPIAADGTPLPGCGTTQGRRLGGTGAKACYGNGPCPYKFRSR